jgi:putative Holliday junction resolvase
MTTSSENFPAAVPTEGALLGLDYGHVRVGIAVSTYEQNIACPLENYTRGSDDADAEHLRSLADEYRIVGIVVGLPVHMSGEESESSHLAREFGAWVGRVTGRPVAFWDERFTSSLAEAHLLAAEMTKKQRKARRDKLAAMLLLQSYLDADDRDRARPPSYER